MKTLFKKIWIKMNAANDDLDWMDVKELSERAELSGQVLKEAYRIHMADKKKFNKACDNYAKKCKKKRTY